MLVAGVKIVTGHATDTSLRQADLPRQQGTMTIGRVSRTPVSFVVGDTDRMGSSHEVATGPGQRARGVMGLRRRDPVVAVQAAS